MSYIFNNPRPLLQATTNVLTTVRVPTTNTAIVTTTNSAAQVCMLVVTNTNATASVNFTLRDQASTPRYLFSNIAIPPAGTLDYDGPMWEGSGGLIWTSSTDALDAQFDIRVRVPLLT